MLYFVRKTADRLFTGISLLSILLMIAALVIFLYPIFQKGSKAVIFNGTVEFRKMQFELFHRGDGEKLDAQTRAANHYKAVAFDMLDNF
ncbi:MAG TPA: phosphate ABC transporter, permease protein PstA, partial [Phycisphaerae bacterium]|nr:phosphate ABC transporter, permease protein PstA [Phycisphaerae bacterium]